MVGEKEKELIETLDGIRDYMKHQLRVSVSRIYLDWAIGVIVACLSQEILLMRLPSRYVGIAIGLVWASIFVIVWLDTMRSFSKVNRLLKLIGREDVLREFWRDRWRSIVPWIFAAILMFPSFWVACSFGYTDRAIILSALTFVGAGNLLMWIFAKRPLETLLVGASLIASIPLIALLAPEVANIVGCLLISLMYALAGVSIYFRWRP